MSKVKAVDKNKVCKFIKELEDDELKAENEYNKVIEMVETKHPEFVNDFKEILSDETNHAEVLSRIMKKIKCK